MNWTDFILGGMTVIFSYAFYCAGMDDGTDVEDEDLGQEDSNLVVSDFSGRHVTLSCQSCRKLKRHKEVQPNLYQCVKCKRHVDLRAS
ncbi:hypothetical protein RCG19_16155 [Neobacillus sp. OS1-2]|uniref:hypothetical protein n=1 Tax=Neobacillus sp. OS1-2 TaxID=3070680 RepID=UPI0027DFEBE8|nr:hypothetical protein [Neobacillus sp. OS1-2]WML38721.1 hypothetical protein RCG19_16155 [Neobacillus sp. OS1-2]